MAREILTGPAQAGEVSKIQFQPFTAHAQPQDDGQLGVLDAVVVQRVAIAVLAVRQAGHVVQHQAPGALAQRVQRGPHGVVAVLLQQIVEPARAQFQRGQLAVQVAHRLSGRRELAFRMASTSSSSSPPRTMRTGGICTASCQHSVAAGL